MQPYGDKRDGFDVRVKALLNSNLLPLRDKSGFDSSSTILDVGDHALTGTTTTKWVSAIIEV